MLYLHMTSIGYQISQKRREYGLTQTELARRAGLPQPNLSNIEKGRQDLTVSTLIRIARTLGLSPGKFFEEPDAPETLFTRERVERLAAAVWNTAAPVLKEDRWIVERLRVLLPGALKRSAGRMAVERAWFELRGRLSPVEIKLLVQHTQGARQRQGSPS